MAFAFRFVGYIVGGGILLALVNPPPGPVSWAAVLLYIVGCAYLDAVGIRAARMPLRLRHGEGVVKMDAYRAGKHRAAGHGPGKPERRTPRPVFDTTQQSEAEGLLALLRGKGLHPIMVTRRTAGDASAVAFEVRLPEAEIPRAKSLMSQYIARKSAPLN
jgi:hypothetical protein